MTKNSYEGRDVGTFGSFHLTESTIRPRGFRFEASRRDGSASLFSETAQQLRDEIAELEDAIYGEISEIEDAMNGRR